MRLKTRPAKIKKDRLKLLNQADRNAIVEFAERIRRKFGDRLRFIKLFGSKARGHDELFSDIDLFVVLERANTRTHFAVNHIAFEIDLKHDVVLSPIVYSSVEYNDPRRRITPFFKNVMKEGIAV